MNESYTVPETASKPSRAARIECDIPEIGAIAGDVLVWRDDSNEKAVTIVRRIHRDDVPAWLLARPYLRLVSERSPGGAS